MRPIAPPRPCPSRSDCGPGGRSMPPWTSWPRTRGRSARGWGRGRARRHRARAARGNSAAAPFTPWRRILALATGGDPDRGRLVRSGGPPGAGRDPADCSAAAREMTRFGAVTAAVTGPKTRDPGGWGCCTHDLRPPGRFNAASSSRIRRSASARARASASARRVSASARLSASARRAGLGLRSVRLGLRPPLGPCPPLHLRRQVPDLLARPHLEAHHPVVTAPRVPLRPQPHSQRLQVDPPLVVRLDPLVAPRRMPVPDQLEPTLSPTPRRLDDHVDRHPSPMVEVNLRPQVVLLRGP